MELPNVLHEPDEEPRFTHDCHVCIFLGHYAVRWTNGKQDHDVYICPIGDDTPLGPSILFRYGSDGPDYQSTRLSILWRDTESWMRKAAARFLKPVAWAVRTLEAREG